MQPWTRTEPNHNLLSCLDHHSWIWRWKLFPIERRTHQLLKEWQLARSLWTVGLPPYPMAWGEWLSRASSIDACGSVLLWHAWLTLRLSSRRNRTVLKRQWMGVFDKRVSSTCVPSSTLEFLFLLRRWRVSPRWVRDPSLRYKYHFLVLWRLSVVGGKMP